MARSHKKIDIWSLLIIFSLGMLDIILWKGMIGAMTIVQSSKLYFFNVTQGEAVLALFPHNIKIMVDAGGDNKIVDELDSALSSAHDNYIDLAIISYPQIDNYEGYASILDHYKIGAFIYNGRNDGVDTKEWLAFLQKLQEKNTPLITVGLGDSIHYGKNVITFLSPNSDFAHSANLTDTALIEHIYTPFFSALLVSDSGKNIQNILSKKADLLRADIYKVPFPIVGISSTQYALHVIDPKIIIVSPGIKNTPSVPSKAFMATLSSSTNVLILRTDQNGTIVIEPNAGTLRIVKER